MAKAHPRLAALDLLHFVFDHFIARLVPDEVPSGHKLTARFRGECAFQLVPRELRRPIRMIAEAVSKGSAHEVEGKILNLAGLLSTLSPFWNETAKFLRDGHGYERKKGYENIERAIADAIPLPYEVGRLLVAASAVQDREADERAYIVNLLQRLKAFEFWRELLDLWLAQVPGLPRVVADSLGNFFCSPDNTIGFERLIDRLAQLDLRTKLEHTIAESVLLCLRARLTSRYRLPRDMQTRILEVTRQYKDDPRLGALVTEIEKIVRAGTP